jgi:glycosyltransferase involved in cell wall biosynthesis
MRVLQELNFLRASGASVFLATPPGSPLYQKARAAGVEVLPVRFRWTIDLTSFWQIFRAIRKYQVDIVNTHSGKDTWMAGLAARLAGAVFVRTQHFLKPRRWYRSHWIYQLADHVITTGEIVRQDVIDYCRVPFERVTSIPSGPNHHSFDPQCFDRAAARKRLGLANSDIAVGTLSRISAQKGMYVFLQAVAPLLQRYEWLRVYVAGDGDEADQVKAYVRRRGMESRIRFLGFIDAPGEYLAALDVYVLPSLKEGLPQSLLQALFMGLPAVATRVGSVEELGEDAVLLVQPGDEVALGKALACIITDSGMRRRMAEKARSTILGRYTEKLMQERTLELYRRLLT